MLTAGPSTHVGLFPRVHRGRARSFPNKKKELNMCFVIRLSARCESMLYCLTCFWTSPPFSTVIHFAPLNVFRFNCIGVLVNFHSTAVSLNIQIAARIPPFPGEEIVPKYLLHTTDSRTNKLTSSRGR